MTRSAPGKVLVKALVVSTMILLLMAGGETVGSPPDAGGEGAVEARGRLRKVLKVTVGVCAGVAVLWLYGRVLERRMLFHPSAEPVTTWRPSEDVEGCWFRAADGTELFGWWHPGRQASGEHPVLLWCHGNAGNISGRWEGMRALAANGLAVFLFDYRGYGRSEGSPSEEGLYRDAAAAYDFLVEERGIEPGRVVGFGRSLGAAVALELVLNRSVAGLVLEGAFENIGAMAHAVIPLIPSWYPTRYDFDNLAKVDGLRVPLLMIHGEHDGIVPPTQGRAVFDAAPQPKEFYTVPRAGHNDTLETGGNEYLEKIAGFCRRCVETRR